MLQILNNFVQTIENTHWKNHSVWNKSLGTASKDLNWPQPQSEDYHSAWKAKHVHSTQLNNY
ncbi:MAG: hypothetical protein ACKESC_01505 [Candidatus Hodgkinia cicadicola]